MDIIWNLIYINEVVVIFFFELSEMKDKKYPNKVWIDLIYLDSIWLKNKGQKRMLFYDCK